MKSKILSVKHSKHGVLHSEALFLCSIIENNSIETIIESGTCLASSTEYFAKCFPEKNIITVDRLVNEGRGTYEIASEKLKKYNNVKQVIGDSFELVPLFVQKSRNICLFIDGPKGMDAIRLMKKCVTEQVKVISFHDFTSEQIKSFVPSGFKIVSYKEHMDIYGDRSSKDFMNSNSVCSLSGRYKNRENIVVMVRE